MFKGRRAEDKGRSGEPRKVLTPRESALYQSAILDQTSIEFGTGQNVLLIAGSPQYNIIRDVLKERHKELQTVAYNEFYEGRQDL